VGSDFRSERYTGFFDRARRREAAETFRAQGFTHLVCVGGNGTLEGTKAMLDEFDRRPPTAFVNVSIRQRSCRRSSHRFRLAVEAGATVARALLETRTPTSAVYILEMMGNRSGRHARTAAWPPARTSSCSRSFG